MIYRDKDPSLLTLLKQKGLEAFGFDPGPLDNWDGAKTESAYQAFLKSKETFSGIASTFADPADLLAFKAAKKSGMSDLQAFAVGDNGIGASGAITSQDTKPMIALHLSDITAKWGTARNGWGKQILVSYKDNSCVATLEDYMSSDHARIDLNPAAVKQLNLPPTGMVRVVWEWIT